MQFEPPKILKSEVMCETDRFKIVRDELEFLDGWKQDWQYAVHKGNCGARVCAVTEDEKIVLVKEYRGAARSYVLRAPAGYVEEGEDPLEAARRELLEETGLKAENVVPIGVRAPTLGSFLDLTAYMFMAYELEQKETNREGGEMDMEIVYIPFDEALEMVMNLEIPDLETVEMILAVNKHLKR